LPPEWARVVVDTNVLLSAAWVEPGPNLVAKTWSSDPDDDAFIRTAFAAGAQRLVSGDDDLLSLHPLSDLWILAPRAAMEALDQATK
jgi:predicted nucleic acid-binding protein